MYLRGRASKSSADVIMFEIEDGVPPSEKPAARQNLIAALNDLNWGRKSLSVRINGLDTPHIHLADRGRTICGLDGADDAGTAIALDA